MINIELKEQNLIAKGGERDCFVYPSDSSKVIKVLHTSEKNHNNQNDLEYSYMNYLEKKSTDLSCLTLCYGFVQTNKGKGLVFQRVLDYDKTPSKSFRYMLANKLISQEYQRKLIEQLKLYLEQNLILFVDTSLTNIFCQKINESEYKLIIVDGLGAKRTGFKFLAYKLSSTYTKYKIKRQWEKFIKMYEKDIKRVNLGTRPFTRL